MCQQLNISRTGYHIWLHREKPANEVENEQLVLWIKEYDEKFKHTLGIEECGITLPYPFGVTLS